MNFIFSLLISFCVACVFIGSLYVLCPNGAMSKPVKYIFALVFLVTVIAASGVTLRNSDTHFEFTGTDSLDFEALDIASAEYSYAYALSEAGIEFEEITVCTDKLSNGSIVISKVIIQSDCEKAKIVEALGEAAENFEVEVINE